ncbi:MAG: hypothetical protein KJ915_03805 [Candidatus Omnitrophica bacterium]|nr:hypothetical protein [Candidatus Omnitrophota bacterium]
MCALFISTTQAFAREWRTWGQGSGISVSMSADKIKVVCGEKINLSVESSDSDTWEDWEQGDESNPLPEELKDSGISADSLLLVSWTCEGGGQLTGSGNSVEWTAPGKPGEYTVKVLVSNDKSAQYCDEEQFVKKTITVTGAKLSHLIVSDNNAGNRNSRSLLNMVKKSTAQSRAATVIAYKTDNTFEWAKQEPIWTGAVEKKGNDAVNIETNKSCYEFAEAGGAKNGVNIVIVDGKRNSFVISKGEFKELEGVIKRIANALQCSEDAISFNITGNGEWYKVDCKASPEVGTTVEVTGGGSGGLEIKSKYFRPPNFPPIPGIDYGVNVSAGITLDLNSLHIVKDGRDGSWPTHVGSGKLKVSGGVAVGIKTEDITILSHTLTAGAEAGAKISASGSFGVYANAKDGAGIEGSYNLGEVVIEGKIVVEVKEGDNDSVFYEYKLKGVIFEGFSDNATVSLTNSFNKN